MKNKKMFCFRMYTFFSTYDEYLGCQWCKSGENPDVPSCHCMTQELIDNNTYDEKLKTQIRKMKLRTI